MKQMRAIEVLTLGMLVITAGCHRRIQQNLQAGVSEGAIIEDVIIANNRRIPTETIKSVLQTKPGDHLTAKTIRADIQKLHSLGYFDDVRFLEENGTNGGKTVIFQVREKP